MSEPCRCADRVRVGAMRTGIATPTAVGPWDISDPKCGARLPRPRPGPGRARADDGFQDLPHFGARQDDGQAFGTFGADAVDTRQLPFQDLLVEESNALKAWFCVLAET